MMVDRRKAISGEARAMAIIIHSETWTTVANATTKVWMATSVTRVMTTP